MDDAKVVSIFGKRVAERREQRGLSQQELARLARTSYQTVWRIENGLIKSVGIDLAARVARALQADLNYLAGLYDERDLLAAGVAVAGT